MTEDEKKDLSDLLEKNVKEREVHWKQTFENAEMKNLQSGVVSFKKYAVITLIIIIVVFSVLILYNAANMEKGKKTSITGMVMEQSAPASLPAPKIETPASTPAPMPAHKDVDLYENKFGPPSPIPELEKKFTTNGDPILIQ